MKKYQFETARKLMSESRWSEAAEALTKAMAVDKRGDFRFFSNRSFCLEMLGRLDDALADAETAVALKNDHICGFYRMGCVLMAMKRFRYAEGKDRSFTDRRHGVPPV